jgi:sulfatase modifying factor 1
MRFLGLLGVLFLSIFPPANSSTSVAMLPAFPILPINRIANFPFSSMFVFDYPMIEISGGTFQMGSPEEESGRGHFECPHPVSVKDFKMGQWEVNQQQWSSVMGYNPSEFKECPTCPVENVSYKDIHKFIQKLQMKTGKKYRLPTEIEWEYAARGGQKATLTKYAGGTKLMEVAWYTGNSGRKTHPVGEKRPNELGLFDMSGNVQEWCADWFLPYPGCAGENRNGVYRVQRGGSWYHYEDACRVAARDHYQEDFRNPWVGFRLVLSN